MRTPGTWTAEDTISASSDESGWSWLEFFATYHGTGDNAGTWAVDWINPVPIPRRSMEQWPRYLGGALTNIAIQL